MKYNRNYEVIIIGGSHAGLSAAMTLGRSLRHTLVIDAGEPCNRFTPHAQNFITQDGQSPQEIRRISLAQLETYETIHFLEAKATHIERVGNKWQIKMIDQTFESPLIILATGLKDELPDWEGALACWGKSLIHCPYCHGYEWRNKKTALIASADKAAHLVPLIHQLTSQLTLLTNGQDQLTKDLREALSDKHIPWDTRSILRMEHQDGYLKSIHFVTGLPIKVEAAYGVFPVRQSSDFAFELGANLNDNGFIQVDAMQQTTVKGLLACGDATGMMRSVAAATSSGQMAGAMANKWLADLHFYN
jgi:thioredoxin reductase